jgi:hypothetical protein
VSAEDHDFRCKPDSVAVGKGVKFFVPWGLYGVVGEWGFFSHPTNPSCILGENLNMNDEWVSREMYQDIPRNNLQGHGIVSGNYEYGVLEDWVKGALYLNGKNQYCDISDTLLRKGYSWSKTRCDKEPCQGRYDGEKRVTVDMDINDFLIEAIFRTAKGHRNGGLVSKWDKRGYTLDIDGEGAARLRLDFGDVYCSRSSMARVNDGEWHHVIVEVIRCSPEGINIYVDGKLSNGGWKGTMNEAKSLSNAGNFTVGKTLGPHENYLEGAIDFLRIARGTLADAETNIGELYQWEFDGPFLKDFFGRPRSGEHRCAGAMAAYF